MLPDLDVLIDSPADPLLQLEYHRQFTHSLLFIPAVALLASILLWWVVRRKLSFGQCYLFCLLGAATAGMADALTSYGVQLLWPFIDTRFAWNIISVFDPLFTLGLAAGLLLALFRNKRAFALGGLAWVALYLLFGLVQYERARTAAQELADRRGHRLSKVYVKPTIANEILWSIRYVSDDTLYADGLRLVPFTDPVFFEGASKPLLNWQKEYGRYKGTVMYRDIRRFRRLSDGVLVAHPELSQVIGDGRYAMLPTSIRPLWGIKADTTQPDSHTDFKTYRDAGPRTRNSFMEMLFGN